MNAPVQGMSSLGDMRRLLCGFSITIAISVVAELAIADHLAKGPRSASDLARLSGTDKHFLRRVLRFLASEGVFAEPDRDVFALTALSEWLRSDVPGSLRPRAVFSGSKMSWSAWGSLLSSVRTGASGMEAAFGETLFEHVKSHPEAAASFNGFMAGQTAASVAALLAAYSFEGVRQIVDVGGGHGALVAGVLQAYPEMRGVLFDMPEVAAKALPLLEKAGVARRAQVVGGDFFSRLPTGADLYALKFILHDWRDAECTKILKNCCEAMAPGGRALIIEHIVPEESGPHFSRFMDINMLVMTDGGQERTEREFIRLLNATGLQLRRSVPTAIGVHILECVSHL